MTNTTVTIKLEPEQYDLLRTCVDAFLVATDDALKKRRDDGGPVLTGKDRDDCARELARIARLREVI